MFVMSASILWAGPGMGELAQNLPWWDKIFRYFINEKNLKISKLKLIDILDEPLPFFDEKWAGQHNLQQITAKENFLITDESAEWDIIILDFIEAWLLGKKYWVSIQKTPFEKILKAWSDKILKLQPQQVWVCHDAIPQSTIQPILIPDYQIIASNIPAFTKSELWDLKALSLFDYWRYITVWEKNKL